MRMSDCADGTQTIISYISKFALNKETILFIITILSLKSILSVDLRACDKSIVCGCKVAV